jgi:hypothetical protein
MTPSDGPRLLKEPKRQRANLLREASPADSWLAERDLDWSAATKLLVSILSHNLDRKL